MSSYQEDTTTTTDESEHVETGIESFRYKLFIEAGYTNLSSNDEFFNKSSENVSILE